jgi:hypothetical protein
MSDYLLKEMTNAIAKKAMKEVLEEDKVKEKMKARIRKEINESLKGDIGFADAIKSVLQERSHHYNDPIGAKIRKIASFVLEEKIDELEKQFNKGGKKK